MAWAQNALAQSNQPPTVSIIDPDDGFVIIEGAPITLFARAEDSQGTSLFGIQWSSDKDGFLGSCNYNS